MRHSDAGDACPMERIGPAAGTREMLASSVTIGLEAEAWTLDRLYQAHARDVARWVARLGGPEIEVEDLVHEVFLTIDARLQSFRGEGSLKSWIYGITENTVRAARRKERIRRAILGRRKEELIPTERPTTPLEEIERQAALRLVYRVLDRMKDAERTALILHELEELSGPEIAELTQVRASTVWVRLHRARASFQAELARIQGRER
jgi:RNA polymerase sigma-70 factor (ECF subfamily)